MAQVLIFVVVGLAAGSVYALAGVGVVVTYRTTGVLNIGTGAIATVAAYLFYTLSVSHGVAWPIAAVLVILVLGTALGLILEPFGRRVRAAPLTFQVAGTVGILLAIEAASGHRRRVAEGVGRLMPNPAVPAWRHRRRDRRSNAR